MKNENEKNDGDKIFNNFSEGPDLNPPSRSILSPPNSFSNNEINTTFGEFVLLMDNKEEYKKNVIDKARKKIRKAVDKIKKTKNIDEIYKDPSLNKWYIINPDKNKFKPFFEALFCLLLYIDFILSPFEYFVNEYSFKYYRIAIFDIFFSLEIISNFFTSYYDTHNKYYITDIKRIFLRYLREDLIPSLLYVLPIYILEPKFEILRFIKLYRYPYVNSMIWKLSMWLLSLVINNIKICSNIVQIFTLLLSTCYITHLCGCFYCFLGYTYYDSWIYNHINLLEDTSYLEIYTSSYYFIAETLSSTGFGDLTPINNAELLFIMFCEIINCGLFTYLLSVLLGIMFNKEHSNSYKFRADQIYLENWIRHYMKKLPASSRNYNLHRNKIWGEIKKYYEIYYTPTKNFDWLNKNNFLTQMKPCHRNELLSKAFKPIFNKFYSFFKRIHLLSSKIKIVFNFKTSVQISNTELTNNRKKNHKIYFIDTGMVDIYKNDQFLITLPEGYFFGLESIVNYDNDNNDEKISYKVNRESPYVILYTIDINLLFKEILNYDCESFNGLINLANIYIENIFNRKNIDFFRNEKEETMGEVSIPSIQNIDSTGIFNRSNNSNLSDSIEKNKNENNITADEDNNKSKRRINEDLINPGILPELEEKIADLKRARDVADRAILKLDLTNKQILFIRNYTGNLSDDK